MRMFNTLNLSI